MASSYRPDPKAIVTAIERFLDKGVLEMMSAAALVRSGAFRPERIWPLYEEVLDDKAGATRTGFHDIS